MVQYAGDAPTLHVAPCHWWCSFPVALMLID
jgi:hypothetical protein